MGSIICAVLVILLLALAGRGYQSTLPHFRVLYVSSGAAGALVDENRRATLFAALPPSKERQISLLANCYWLLIRGGARGVSTVVITDGSQKEGIWRDLPFRPRLVVDAVTGTVACKSGTPMVPQPLDSYAADDGALGVLSVALSGSGETTVLLPVADRLSRRLTADIPQRIALGSNRILVVPGGSARGALGAFGDFLSAHRLDAVILQGRGAVPQSLLQFTGRTEFYTQREKKELSVSSDGEIEVYGGNGGGD